MGFQGQIKTSPRLIDGSQSYWDHSGEGGGGGLVERLWLPCYIAFLEKLKDFIFVGEKLI